MRLSFLVLGLVLFGTNGAFGGDIRSSLTFVIDDTGSMEDDIAQVKAGANSIFDTVMNSNSSQIEDFVLATFNDPTTKLRAKTKDRRVFKNALNTIHVHGGDDCPEVAMDGIKLGLQNSREGSSLYVFTDASATDYDKYNEVVALSQKMGCQITFVLTGICYGNKEAEGYKVYKKLARATNGQVFHLKRQQIGEILNYVKLSIESRKNVLISKTFPRGHGSVDINVDADMKELVISVAGKSPLVTVTDSKGKIWPADDVTRLSETTVVKVVGVTPDNYTVEVDSEDETYVVVSAATSVHFQHGFSTIEPSAITDTVRQPVPGVKSHLSIQLSTEGTEVELRSVQILDMDDEVILQTPLKLVDKAEQFYTTQQIILPDELFRIAIKGYDVKTNTYLTRISLTPIQPQEIIIDTVETKAPVVECKTDVTVAYGKPLQLTCRVSGWPQPDVIWQSDDTSVVLSHFVSTVELPYKYVSVMELPSVKNNATYTCKAVNSEGEGIASTRVHTKITNFFRLVAAPKDITVEYHKSAVIPCKINAYPPATVYWYKGGYPLQPDGNTQLSADGSTLTIRSMEPYIADNYICEARNSVATRVFTFKVDITVEYHKSAVIPCKINAYPPATVYWYKGGYPLQPDGNTQLSADGSTLTIRSMEPYIADNYICEARNSVATRVFTFKVDISGVEAPEIDKTVTDIKAVQNSKANIRCPISKGFPEPTIRWSYKEDGGSEFIPLYFTTDTIHLDKVKSSDAGTYMCMADNSVGLDFQEIYLIVEYAPSFSRNFKTIVTVSEGDTVILKCPAVGAPAPEFSWKFEGHPLRSIGRYYILTDGTLRFTAISSDEGEYECEASNSLGAVRIDIKLYVNVLPILESPKESSIKQKEGLPVALPCRADGSPKPTITWYHRSNDPTVEPKKLAPSDRTGRLRFVSIQLAQSGEYTCVATNSKGSRNVTYTVSVLAPPTIYYTTTEFEGVVDDMQLRIPCNNTGNPKPEITWSAGGYEIASGSKWHTVGNDGSLTIKIVNKGAEGTYTCNASNKFANTQKDFNVVVLDSPDPGFLSSVITVDPGTSRIIPCIVPHKITDRVRWFKDGRGVSSSVLELRDVTKSDSGIYTCRVSSVDRPPQTGSTKVEVGFKPQFTYDAEKDIPFVLGEPTLMDCSAIGVPEPEVKWYHDDREISFTEFKYELEMSYDTRGRYTCVVTNKYGTVQQEFVISSFECLLDVTKDVGTEPLMLTSYNTPTHFKTIDGFIHIPRDEVVKFVCPSSFNYIRSREIILTCEKDQQFLQQSSGERFAYSDLKCRDKWQPIVNRTGHRCMIGNSERLKIGFQVNGIFQEVYEVCLDRTSNNTIYTKLKMEPSLANVAVNNHTEWFDGGFPVDLDNLYDCSNQNAEITSILSTDFHNDGCCFAKRMLVNPLDVAPGKPQAATYTHLNVAPHWGTCNSKNWEDVERRIRNLVKSSNRPLQVWTGTAENLQLADASSKQQNVVLNSSGKDVQVPKYLWKVVQDSYSRASLAIIQVNVPDLKLTDARSYMRCTDVCKEAEWMRDGRWRNVNRGFTYCCSLPDFERAFRFYAAFPNYDKKLLEVSDIPDDHYLHAI